jgi:F-type H+-transporting ATPase subunit delta
MEPKPDKKTAKATARPYAKAAYEAAKAEFAVEDWKQKLSVMAEILADPAVQPLFRDPNIGKAERISVMEKVLDEIEATEGQRNFVMTLIENKRLSLMPWISTAFEEERKKDLGIVDVRVISAMELTPQQVENTKRMLSEKFNAKAEPVFEVDPDLIGGMKLIIGDRVIDNTIKGKLERLKKHLDKPGP